VPTLAAGEPLAFHGPGWTIRTDRYEVICWAPGQVVHQGQPTGELRTEWLLSVELPPAPVGARSDARPCRSWESGGFLAGASLNAVLPALALLHENDRRRVTDVLTAQLIGVAEPTAGLIVQASGMEEADGHA
jgi:hypothetical protein